MSRIMECNGEDLAPTWAVFKWLRGKGDATHVPAGRKDQKRHADSRFVRFLPIAEAQAL